MIYPKAPMSPQRVNTILDACLQSFGDDMSLSATQKLDFYHTKRQRLLHQYLVSAYPMCLQLIGESYFTQIAEHYIAQFPARYLDLVVFGEGFPDFIFMQSLQVSALRGFPYLKEVARLECLQYQVYFAEPRPEFDFEVFFDLSVPQFEDVSFLLAPDIRVMQAHYAVALLWDGGQKCEPLDKMLIPKVPEFYCIVRQVYTLELIKIEESLYDLLQRIVQGESMASLYKFDRYGYLPELMKSGWVCGLQF